MVSHSRALAEAAVELAREMLNGQDVPLEVAAGLDDGSLGTDAVAVMTAVEAADRGSGVVVLMDLGSAVLSTELALEMLDDDLRARVALSPAPVVEGLVAASVAAAGGASRQEVAAEAARGLAGKLAHLGGPAVGGQAGAGDLGAGGAGPGGAGPGEAGAGGAGAGQVEATVVLTGAHGLHARPAARLVTAARDAGGSVEVRNATSGSPWVPATSLTQVATLGVLSGHALGVRSSGPGAAQAVAALVELVRRDGDEAPATTAPSDQAPTARQAPVPPGPPAPAAALQAPATAGPLGASPGIAIGPAWQRRAARRAGPYTPASGPDEELSRLDAARERCRTQLQRTRERTAEVLGEQEAAVFDAHVLLLDDDDLRAEAVRRIEAGEPAPSAWSAAARRVRDSFAALPDPYLRERAADVDAVADQVLQHLLGADADSSTGERTGVLVAPDLGPAEAVALDPRRVAGVVLAAGSPTSHSAILLRGLGIPAVVGAGAAVLGVADGTVVALDGSTGELALDPDEAVLTDLRARADALAQARRVAAGRAAEPARTRDGAQVHVAANLGSVADADAAGAAGADLAGLVRTEFLFLGRDRAPDVEEQEDVYRRIAAGLGGRRVVLRTLDVGGDKPLPYVASPREDNPFLGMRGLRLSLTVPGLLADQLLAVVRVARDTPVSVMFPMVTTLGELLAARRLLDDALARAGGGRPAGLRVGMMVEVPAAALKTAAFAPHVDFLSVGTNDLAQYALAAERGNPAVAGLSDACDPGVLQLVAAVCDGAGQAQVAVCGELAGDPSVTGLLLGLGVRELSVSARSIALVKAAVREVDLDAARRTASAALRATTAAQVRASLGTAAGG